jgi:glycosyltransferase 2 family protein
MTSTNQQTSEQISPPSRYTWVGPVASGILIAASLFVLWQVVHTLNFADVLRAFKSTLKEQLFYAFAFTIISYVCLTGYDALALWQLGLKIKKRTTALASFCSYAVSFNLGFPLITGGTVRYWIYKPAGVTVSNIANLTLICGITFWLGMALILGWSLLKEAELVSWLSGGRLSLNMIRILGVSIFGGLGAYFIWVGLKPRHLLLRGWQLHLPNFRLSFAQMLLGIADVAASAAVLFVLLPAQHGLTFEAFLAIYVAAVMLGIASHSPGGLGVFEATMLLALSHISKESVVGSLLLFRLIYYFMPFVLALALLGGYEIWGRVAQTKSVFKHSDLEENER